MATARAVTVRRATRIRASSGTNRWTDAATYSTPEQPRAGADGSLPRLRAPHQLLADHGGAGSQAAQLLVAHVARGPAKAAVGVQRELLGRTHPQHPPDAAG